MQPDAPGEPRAATRLLVAIFRDFCVHTVHAVGAQAPKCLVKGEVCTAHARWSPRLLRYSLCFPASCLLSSCPQPGTLTRRTRTTRTQADTLSSLLDTHFHKNSTYHQADNHN